MISDKKIINKIVLSTLIIASIFFGVIGKEKNAYSRNFTNQKYSHKNLLIREKVISLMDKHFSSEAPTNKSSFNNNVQQLVSKMSYPLNRSSRVGLIVKNKMKVGISMEF